MAVKAAIESLGLILACPEHRRSELQYAMDFIASALGVNLRVLRATEPCTGLKRLIVVGAPEGLSLPADLHLVLLIPYQFDDRNASRQKAWIEPGPLPVFGEYRGWARHDGVPWRYRDHESHSPFQVRQEGATTLIELGFDPLGPVFRWLARVEETRPEFREAARAASSAGSWMAAHKVVDYPWIDRLLQFLQNLLDLRSDAAGAPVCMPRWPKNHRWAVCLSHDVDMLYKWRARSVLHLLLRTPLYAMSTRWRRLATEWREVIHCLRGGRDPWFLVEEMADLEEHWGLMSSFLFLAESHDHQTYRYHVSRTQVNELLTRLKERGREVALHAGWYTMGDRARLQDERALIERLSGDRITVVRQHWLRCDREQTWQDQELSGLTVDSSLGWNDSPGYRAGTGLPFYPWNLTSRRAHELLEIPLVLMDSQLYDEMKLEAHEALESSHRLLDLTRRTGSLLTINWHPHVLCREDFPDRRDHYQHLLQQIAEGNAWVAGLGTVGEHWKRRERYRRGGRQLT